MDKIIGKAIVTATDLYKEGDDIVVATLDMEGVKHEIMVTEEVRSDFVDICFPVDISVVEQENGGGYITIHPAPTIH
jgi:hypothetical protein